MALNVKNKIWLGTFFLFLLLLLTGGISIYYMAKLKAESENILHDNYKSVEYSGTMQRQLSGIIQANDSSKKIFENALQLQENNITEAGEKNATAELRNNFNKIITADSSKEVLQLIQKNINTIDDLNMIAIRDKNNKAEATASQALNYIIFLSGMVFLIAFTFILNFPSVVTKPIKQLSAAIKEIANKNYKHRIHIDNKDEFGNLADSFNQMAERLEYFESSNLNKLMFEKSRAEAVINSLKDASIGIDKNNCVLFANEQALQLLGVKKENVVGKSVEGLNSSNDLFKFLIENDSSAPFKIVVDNRENYFIKELMQVEQGDTKNKVIIIKNITSFKELDVAKNNFIATVSHELKTPLASSDFSLKLLEDNRVGDLTKEQKDLVQNLKNDNMRMLRILSELLNMSQVEAGKIQLNIQDISPYQIVESSVAAVANAAKERQIIINQKLGKSLPDINADPDKISWVLNNFLTNAIKYSPEKSVISILVEKVNSSISFSVADKGQGIDEAYTKQIFERYYQIPGRSDKKGSGIGLAICKEFIEAMNGTIWIKSEIGTGSTFGFSFNLA
jgi:signal transduction histidine kinase